MSPRERRVEIFHDTLDFINENPILHKASIESRDKAELYLAHEWPEVTNKEPKAGNVTLLKRRTFEAALYMHEKKPESKIAVLNFASATNPGGGVMRGSGSQEECLCRCSTLYTSLAQPRMINEFYTMHRGRNNPLYTDACIYTPNVIICKTDTDFPVRIKNKDFIKVDVITCAAPNLREVGLDQTMHSELMTNRIKHIFHVAHAHNIDTLILGAFGCGAFANNPVVVASCFLNMVEKHGKDFEDVVFAIYNKSTEADHYKTFKTVFGF